MNVQSLLDWLEIESTTGIEENFLRRLEEELAGLGLAVTRQSVERHRWNVFASYPGVDPEIIYCTHVDTVPPFFGPRVDDDGTIRARGACDTKGGIFSMFEAWKLLSEHDQARTGFLFVVGEEVDHVGAIVAGREAYPRLRATILGEPTRNHLAVGQKGILKGTLCCTGKAGHSAFPEVGFSAVHKLVGALDGLLAHQWPTDPELGATTLNVGTIQGGVAANVFAPQAEAQILMRATHSVDDLLATTQRIVGDRGEFRVDARNEPTRLLAWADRFATDVVPFNTDAPYINHIAPVILVGPGDIRTAHSPDEHITPAAISEGIELYRTIAAGLLSGELAT